MVWESHMRCGLDPEFNSLKEGGFSMDACKVFDEMLTSELEDWREPSRVLDVTIRHAYYPITNMVLHQVFDPLGAVEINVCELLEYVEAQVIF
jgi:hypothetical protein